MDRTDGNRMGRKVGACLLLSLAWAGIVLAGQQENVDYIIGRIRTSLFASLNAADWQAKYSLVDKNIDDLKNTLRYGGKITSNPVKEYHAQLSAMMEERREEFQLYCDMQAKLQTERNKAANQAINDVGMEMIGRLTSPKPGILSPITQARTKNAEVIKNDFKQLKTIDDAMRQLEGYKKSILPSIHEVRDRKHALEPILARFNALTAVSFDGFYGGIFSGDAAGAIRFTVVGEKVSGTIDGRHKGDPIRGSFSGSIDAVGNIRTRLTGTLTDATGAFKEPFSFVGVVNGGITGGIASGSWNGRNEWGNPGGDWNASKR